MPMDGKLGKVSNKEKIKFWQDKLHEIEQVQLPQAMARLGQSATDGDWHENSEFEDSERQLEIIRTRMDDIKNLINKLRHESEKRK